MVKQQRADLSYHIVAWFPSKTITPVVPKVCITTSVFPGDVIFDLATSRQIWLPPSWILGDTRWWHLAEPGRRGCGDTMTQLSFATTALTSEDGKQETCTPQVSYYTE